MKKILYITLSILLFLCAIHTTFFVLTNMTIFEFLSYLYVEDWGEEEIRVLIPFK